MSPALARRGFGWTFALGVLSLAGQMGARLKFVIVSLPRTGSTYLVDYLDAVDGVRCLSEIFHPTGIMLRHHQPLDPRLLDMSLRDADPQDYLQRLEQEIGECRWFGFKHFPRHGLPLLQQLCASRAWRKIFLWRDNLLDQYFSFLLASAHFGRTGWERVPDDVQMRVPVGMLLEDLHTIQNNYFVIEKALALAHDGDVFALEYEQLGQAAVMRGLLQFLGLPDPLVESALAKTGTGEALRFARGPGPAQRIQNYDEVRSLLRSSRYRRWIDV